VVGTFNGVRVHAKSVGTFTLKRGVRRMRIKGAVGGPQFGQRPNRRLRPSAAGAIMSRRG
jgi:hypothetical protein